MQLISTIPYLTVLFFFLSQRYTQFVHTQGLKDSQCIVFAHHRPSAADTTRTQLRKMTCYLKISICFLLVARHSDLFSSVLDCRSRGSWVEIAKVLVPCSWARQVACTLKQQNSRCKCLERVVFCFSLICICSIHWNHEFPC